MINLVEIGKYIAELRTSNKLSQQELAEKLYVTHQAVSKWEKGKGMPSIEIMVSLTKLFNITIDQLLRTTVVSLNDFEKLLTAYPRSYIINQLIQGKLDFKIIDVLYLLNSEEREIIISHIINHHLDVNIVDLLPYLNKLERTRIIKAIKSKKLDISKREISYMLTINEKNILFGGKNEY
ncbi:MAG: helix-turn-helix domain-containing protein [Bacilli bacterium]|nr:helix-turn-helix domain-containing protein [Bacilli bacterium]